MKTARLTQKFGPSQPAKIIGASLVVAGLLIFYSTVIAVSPNVTIGQALLPWPDGPEYLDAARHLRDFNAYRIHIAGEQHPPRYPFAFSLLISSSLASGVEPAAVVYRVNQVAGFSLFGLIVILLWHRKRYIESGLAGLLIASLPAFLVLSRSCLSEIVGTIPVVSGLWLLYRYTQRTNNWVGWLGALLLGLSVCFRASNFFSPSSFPELLC